MNSIEQIKNKEQESSKNIENARKNVENELNSAQGEYRKKYDNVEHGLTDEIDSIINKVSTYVQEMKEQEKRGLKRAMQRIKEIDKKKIDRAADIVAQKVLD